MNLLFIIGPTLLKLKWIVIPEIKSHWQDVAYISLKYDPSVVAEIEKKCASDPEKCCYGLLNDWLLTQNGVSPKTWETLLNQLKEVKELADKVEKIEKQL